MHSTPLRTSKLFFTLIFFSVLLMLIDSLGVLNSPKSALGLITSPIQYGLYKTSLRVGKQLEFIVLTRRTLQEKKALEEQLAQVLSENARLQRQLAESGAFLAQQTALSKQTFNLVPARPIGIGRYLLIDKGSDDGLKINQTVIYKDNYLGKIKSVSSKKAEIILLSDPDSKIAAFVGNKNGKAKGILLGQFGAEELLDKVLHQEPLEKNDLVYTNGTESDIPTGLVLGQVSEVLNYDNQFFKQAKVKPIFDVTSLDVVFVIIL